MSVMACFPAAESPVAIPAIDDPADEEPNATETLEDPLAAAMNLLVAAAAVEQSIATGGAEQSVAIVGEHPALITAVSAKNIGETTAVE